MADKVQLRRKEDGFVTEPILEGEATKIMAGHKGDFERYDPVKEAAKYATPSAAKIDAATATAARKPAPKPSTRKPAVKPKGGASSAAGAAPAGSAAAGADGGGATGDGANATE